MNKQNIAVLRNIIYAVESGGQIYGKADYSCFIGAGANNSNEKAITIGAGQWYADSENEPGTIQKDGYAETGSGSAYEKLGELHSSSGQ